MRMCPYKTNLVNRCFGRRKQRKQAQRHPRLIGAQDSLRLLIVNHNIVDRHFMQRENPHRTDVHVRSERLRRETLRHRADLRHERLRAQDVDAGCRALLKDLTKKA